MFDKKENSIKNNTLPTKEYDENNNVNNIQNINDCSEDDDLLIQVIIEYLIKCLLK
jgi:hypothetical protein